MYLLNILNICYYNCNYILSYILQDRLGDSIQWHTTSPDIKNKDYTVLQNNNYLFRLLRVLLESMWKFSFTWINISSTHYFIFIAATFQQLSLHSFSFLQLSIIIYYLLYKQNFVFLFTQKLTLGKGISTMLTCS